MLVAILRSFMVKKILSHLETLEMVITVKADFFKIIEARSGWYEVVAIPLVIIGIQFDSEATLPLVIDEKTRAFVGGSAPEMKSLI